MSCDKLSHNLKGFSRGGDVFRYGIGLLMVVRKVLDVKIENFPIERDPLSLWILVSDLEDDSLGLFHLNI